MAKINERKFGTITKNYFHIEGSIEIKDLICSLSILLGSGILVFMEVKDIHIIEKLKKYKHKGLQFPDIGKSITLAFFKKIKNENIAVYFNKDTKYMLYQVAKEIEPDIEICSYLFFLTNDQKVILEYKVDDAIFISRDIIQSDETIRKFCKKIDVDRYCLEEF